MDHRLYGQLREIEGRHWWFRGRRRILLAALEQLDIRATQVLDCGCGAGSNLDLLEARYPRQGLLGVDIEREPLRYCAADHALSVAQADLSELPFAEASFDLVAALDAIEHVADDERALAEMFRVCRPGGHLLVTVPAFPVLWGNIDDAGHHFRRYRRAQLVERVCAAGFEPRLVRYFNFLLFPPIAAIRLAARLRPVRSGDTTRTDFDVVKEGPLNELLTRLFGLEARLLGWPLPFGVSLLMVAQKADPAG